jgi:Na+-driven multidrug efflux pump
LGLSHYTKLGVDGIWWAFPIANLIAAAASLTVFLRHDWTKRALIEKPAAPDPVAS